MSYDPVYAKKWRKKNQRSIRSYRRKYKDANRVYQRGYQRKWRDNNRKKVRAICKKSLQNRSEKVRARSKRIKWLRRQATLKRANRLERIRYKRYSDAFFLFKERIGCKHCGYNEHGAALHFHHRNPRFKRIHVNVFNYRQPRGKREMKKCDLLCANCHSVETVHQKRRH